MTDPPSFYFHLISKHRTALERQIWESLYIEHEECDELLNGKGEWGLNILPRLKPTPENDPLNLDLQNDEPKSKRKCIEINTPEEASTNACKDLFSSQFTQRKKARKESYRTMSTKGRNEQTNGNLGGSELSKAESSCLERSRSRK